MHYPAVTVDRVEGVDSDWVLAVVDDFGPTAVEEPGPGSVRIFFATTEARDRARDAIGAAFPAARLSSEDVDDGNWARRSQENLTAIVVGRITVAPPWAVPESPIPESPVPESLTIVILPSTGFGTGHHATTRLCLDALQSMDLSGRTMLDIGTGSGVLAIAARKLGAACVVGIDHDPDALRAAAENLELNAGIDHVTFEAADLSNSVPGPADVVTANLTGALLCREAAALEAAVRPGGALIASGLLVSERGAVVSAFANCHLAWEREEDGWVGLVFQNRN